ncbi:Elongator complex protein 2 [Hypsibius exemplaris]|uniref:Elongator complex protein 2 n=1 Tax=Hypsibius exemplaris TaxID=2072580 RepID=A0A1W0WKI9_HYPEX|nr:Elongator complex protein 2 [Hypsibius exemplaris]
MAHITSNLIYLSAGCNTSPHCVAWGNNNVVLYASDANIIVCDPTSLKTASERPGFRACQSLRHHSESVNCVRWITFPGDAAAPQYQFISLSSDKTCVIWTVRGSDGENGLADSWKFSVLQQLELKVPLQVGRCIYTSQPGHFSESRDSSAALLTIAGIDGSVTIWIRKDKLGFELANTISFGRGQVLDLDITRLSGSESVLLACGGDDGKIHLFGLLLSGAQSTKLAVLEGHEDWIRTVEFSLPDTSGLTHMLSAGQDCTVRLWTFYAKESYNVDSGDLWSRVNSKQFVLPGSGKDFVVVFDTLLFGHENWIYGAHWAPPLVEGGKAVQPLRILTASMDKTVVIWEPQAEFGGVWSDTSRVGEVGGNNLGFYGCQFSPDGQSILSHSFSGSLHLWTRSEEATTWTPSVVSGGHFSSVNDITWDPRGLYVLSTGQDQSTRLHAPWLLDTDSEEWHEMGRPQVHGYDLQCLARTGPFSFASGAEEKIVRHFQAPKSFLLNFSELSKVDVSGDLANAPEGANVPALGLSNKAVFEAEERADADRHPTDRYPENSFSAVRLTQPPSEEDLIQNTLWPETHKLYGHGYEISSLACNHSCTILASASRATRPEDAEIYLWRVRDPATSPSKFLFNREERLPAHTLTVTQMAFSHNDRFLLSVSRDRTWVLSRQQQQKTQSHSWQYEICTRSDKKNGHSRIVWCCAWTPDDVYFATGSRDKTVCVHNVKEENGQVLVELLHRLTFDEPITALDLTLKFTDHTRYLLVVGIEDGHVAVHSFDRAGTEEPAHLLTLPDKHHKAVNRIRFQPFLGEGVIHPSVLVATCGADCAVKIFKLSTA